MVIQIIVTIGVLVLVLPSIYSSYKRKSLAPFGLIVWLLFWVIGLVIIWFPSLINEIGRILGVTRSIDALVYMSIVFLFYIVFTQRTKTNELEREITMLTRKVAIKDIKKK